MCLQDIFIHPASPTGATNLAPGRFSYYSKGASPPKKRAAGLRIRKCKVTSDLGIAWPHVESPVSERWSGECQCVWLRLSQRSSRTDLSLVVVSDGPSSQLRAVE